MADSTPDSGGIKHVLRNWVCLAHLRVRENCEHLYDGECNNAFIRLLTEPGAAAAISNWVALGTVSRSHYVMLM